MPDALYDKRARYAIFTMNRPERMNAQTPEMRRLLFEALEDFNADPEQRVGILTGAGNAFSTGRDLRQVAASTPIQGPAFAGAEWPGTNLPGEPYPFARSPKPIIAAIHGACVAGGMAVALDCDLRICSNEAYFGLLEPRRGIMAAYAAVHLPRLIGYTPAAFMLLSAERITAEQALAWQLVTEVLPPDELLPRAIAIAESMAEAAPLALQGTKEMLQWWRMNALSDAVRHYQAVNRRVINSADAKEGPRAFAEKRKPEWSGR